MQRKKLLQKRIFAGLCSICLATSGLHAMPSQPVYATETEDATASSDSDLPVLGLSANLFCLSDTADAVNANLQWGDSFDRSAFDHYEVQLETNGSYHTIYKTTGRLFQDYDLTLHQVYNYRVVAMDSNGSILATSNEATVTPTDVASDLDTHSNVSGGDLHYATSGTKVANSVSMQSHQTTDGKKYSLLSTKVGDTYYNYSMKHDNNSYYLVETTSTDGNNFGNERTVADQSQNADLGNCKLESVQMRYIEKVNKMIIWAHWEKPSGYADGKALVITGTPGQAFTVHHIYNPLGIQVRDMSIFVDDDGTGYLISATSKGSEGANHTMRIFKMNSEYNDVTEVTKELYIGQYREFPNMTKRDGYYYLFTSQAAGWYPSIGGYSVTRQISGDWSALQSIGNTSTFSCQSGWIQSVGDKGNCVMHAYRWLRSGDTPGEHLCPMYFANGYAFYDYCTSFRYSTRTGELYPVQEGRLVSLNKPATASIATKNAENGSTFYASNIFDGDYQSYFASSEKKWPFSIRVDLERICDLSNVQISWYMCKGSEAYYTYYIDGSTDGQNWTKLLDRTDTSSERVNKTYGFTNDALTGTARYVRLTVTNAHLHNNPNNNWYTPTIYEMKVFGNPTSQTSDWKTVERDPLAFYPLHADQNGTIKDVMGNKGDLQLHGNYRYVQGNGATDAGSSALYLDGSNGTYATLPDGLVDGLNDFSISFQAKPEQLDKENFFTLAFGIDSSKYFLVKTATNASRFAITKTEEKNNGWKGESGVKSTASASEWSRYTIVVHENTGYLYRDNTLVANGILNQHMSDLGEHLTGYIGKSFYDGDAYYKGSISDIAFYDYALSFDQIQKMNGVLYEKEHRSTEDWICDATSHKKKCSLCGSYFEEGTHTYSDWEVVTPATTQKEGEERHTCTVCGYTESRLIDKKTDTPSASEAPTLQPSEDPSTLPPTTGSTSSAPSSGSAGSSSGSGSASFAPSNSSNGSTSSSGSTGSLPDSSSTGSASSSGSIGSLPGSSSTGSASSSIGSLPGSSSAGSASSSGSTDSLPDNSSAGSSSSSGSTGSLPSNDSDASAPSTGSTGSLPSNRPESSTPDAGSTSSIPGTDSSDPSHTHNFGDWTTVKPATCSEEGEQTRTCTVCGYVQTKKLPMLSHEYTNKWEYDDSEHYHVCTICGEKVNTEPHVLIWKVDVDSTATDIGLRHSECTICGYTGKKEVLPVGHTHTYTTSWFYNDTSHYHVCTECGVADTKTPHSFGDWTLTQPPTLTQKGERVRTCSVCGYKENQTIDVLTPGTPTEPSGASDTVSTIPSEPSDTTSMVPSEPSDTASVIPSEPSDTTSMIPSEPSGTTSTVPSKPSGSTSVAPSKPSDAVQPSEPSKKPLKKNASATVKSNGATYTYKVTNAKTNGSGTVTLIKTTSASTMRVPDKVKLKGHYYKVTALDAKAFQKKTTVTSITIGNNVTKIPDSAFVGCKKLQKISLGSGITKIGTKAFQNDSKLKTIVICSKKLKSIGSKSFKGIYAKASFTVPSSKKNSYKKLLKSSTGYTKKMKLKGSTRV